MNIKLPYNQFIMNDRLWTIKEVEQKEFWEDDNELDKMNNEEYYFGRCLFNKQEIWLYKDNSELQKRKTLYHELLHCYKGSYITFNDLGEQPEDLWCDISANSHDIIHKIVEEYFGNKM